MFSLVVAVGLLMLVVRLVCILYLMFLLQF